MKRLNTKGFTLIELIIVIAIITILAAVLVVTIDPQNLFANARNGTRSSDMKTIQSAFNNYLYEPGTTRLKTDFSGYSALVTAAYDTTPAAVCAGGASGTGLDSVTGAFSLVTAASAGTSELSVKPLLDSNYLTKLPSDPKDQSAYKVCIDINVPASSSASNPGRLVFYAPAAEAVNGSTTIPSSAL